jgi:hypothetical protein
MNVDSFNARIQTLNPNYRLRKRYGLKFFDDTFVHPVGLYLRNKYFIALSFNHHFIHWYSHPLIKARNKETGVIGVVRRQRRGRRSFMYLAKSKKLFTHTWERQLLKI